MSQLYDIAILGASPAGCATASILAGGKLRVALVDYVGTHCESPLADWVPKEFWKQEGVGPDVAEAAGAEPFRVLRFHDSQFQRQAEMPLRPTGGSLVQYARLASVMLDRAKKAGAKVFRLPRRPVIRLGEESILLAAARSIEAKILLIAQGSPHEAIGDMSLPVRPPPRSPFTIAGLDADLPKGPAPKGLEAALNVVASRDRGKLGMFFAVDGVLHLRLAWATGDGGAAAAELSAFLSELQSAGQVPGGLSLRGARGAVWRPPAGEALDLETHAAKRCLLLGTAGGFADSVTGQTLYPSVRSAAVAAKTAQAALASADPQEALMHYKNEWRKLLADSLRPPSTSVDMLMPLLMGNRRLVAKFAKAMLYGQNI